jgi:TonB family protein
VAYGDPVFGDERMLLRVLEAGRIDIARQRGSSIDEWAGLSEWTVEKRYMTFSDSRRGRIYAADLDDRSTLGGTWTAASASGGWWCVQRGDALAAESLPLRRSAAEFYVPPLVLSVMATPRYPRQAIREAKEGRAVVCFVVEPSGAVRDPEIVEISDELFRNSTVAALLRSSYLPWAGGAAPRPGCRSVVYELELTY